MKWDSRKNIVYTLYDEPYACINLDEPDQRRPSHPLTQVPLVKKSETYPVFWTLDANDDLISQNKWNTTIEIELYIQNNPKKVWSQAEIWHVPPLPGPSQGYLNPNVALSGTNREDL